MSTSSNKQQKKGKDGMGKAGKTKKRWCRIGVEQVVCGRVSVSTLCGDKLCVRCVCVCVCACVCVCVRAEVVTGKEGKTKEGEKVREVKTVVWIKLSIRIYYVCRYLCISRKHAFFPQNMMFRNGSICAMKSVPGRTTQNNGLSYLYRKGHVIMKTVSFRSTDW